MEARVNEALRNQFRPEFLNRIDEIILFEDLSQEQLTGIVDIQLRRLEERLGERDITLRLTDAARRLLAEKGYDPVYGARPLKRAIQRYLENPLSLEILQGGIADGALVTADAENGKIAFSVNALEN
jgi:ATP-dependent Clp protease ATP-binding subunit ClpB